MKDLLSNVGSGGGAAAAPGASGAAGGEAAAEAKEEEKSEGTFINSSTRAILTMGYVCLLSESHILTIISYYSRGRVRRRYGFRSLRLKSVKSAVLLRRQRCGSILSLCTSTTTAWLWGYYNLHHWCGVKEANIRMPRARTRITLA